MAMDVDEMRATVRAIGGGNLMAISGGRVQPGPDESIILPVSNGYAVEIEIDRGSDTFIVRRTFRRGAKIWIKGERKNVYVDELGEVAYYASCFRSYDETEWMAKA